MELLQSDLEAIYEWADCNLMQFNEEKFERMSHGKKEKLKKEHTELDQERKLRQRKQ